MDYSRRKHRPKTQKKAPTKYSTRLSRKQKSKNLRIALLMSLLTALFLGALVYYGVPLFIKAAGWWGDVQFADSTIENDDRIAPPPPRVIIPTKVTNQTDIDIKGFAEPGSTVKIFINCTERKQITTENNGQFLASEVKLSSGDNSVYATATDDAGNISQQSGESTITYDNQPPQLVIESPTNNKQFYGSDQQNVEIVGQTDPDTRVWINERLVIMGTEGRFVSSIRLKDGSQDITIRAVDAAGNETTKILTLSYSL